MGHSPAVHSDGVVAGLLLLLLHCCDEVYHAFSLSWNPDLRPAMEVELAHHAGLLLLAGQLLYGRRLSVVLAFALLGIHPPSCGSGSGLGVPHPKPSDALNVPT